MRIGDYEIKAPLMLGEQPNEGSARRNRLVVDAFRYAS